MLKLDSIEINIMHIILPIIYILIGIIIYKILKRVIDKSINVSKITLKSHKQRAETIKMLILNIRKMLRKTL